MAEMTLIEILEDINRALQEPVGIAIVLPKIRNNIEIVINTLRSRDQKVFKLYEAAQDALITCDEWARTQEESNAAADMQESARLLRRAIDAIKPAIERASQ